MVQRILTQLKRTWVELVILTAIGFALFFMPPITKQGLELLLYKILLFSASQVHAHILRLWMFPYIDFSAVQGMAAENKIQQIMVVALHVAAAYVYGVGG